MANTNENDLLHVYNPTKTTFEVKWGGQPYALASGQTRIMPRFIAEHFAKHLADAILLRREENEFQETGKRKTYVTHPVERPKIVNLILQGVYNYHQANAQDPNAAIAQMVDQVNKQPDAAIQAPEIDKEVAEDYGLIPDRAVGNLSAPPATPEEEAAAADTGELLAPDTDPGAAPGVTDAPVKTDANAKPKRTREQLLEEAESLGIEVKPKTPTPQIEKMIQNF